MALRPCGFSQDGGINSIAKHLEEFLVWLLSKQRQVDIPGESCSYHPLSELLRQLWSLSPVIDEIRTSPSLSVFTRAPTPWFLSSKHLIVYWVGAWLGAKTFRTRVQRAH